MPKNLIIIESPNKIKTYKKALGDKYSYTATVGHCIDLPVKTLSINIKKNFEPTFEVKSDRKNTIKDLKKMVKGVSSIFLMTDSDREGEAISWHIKNELEGSTKAKWYRATTSEITKEGITSAIANASEELDKNKINAYLCRRILDRLVGYKTSFLTKQATGGRSAGRVQSAMLRLIVDRELEIKNFNPEEYWVLTAHLINSKKEGYIGVLDEKIKVKNEKQASEIQSSVLKAQPVIKSVDSNEVSVSAYAPFVTNTMIQSGSTLLGWGSKKIMNTAQSLYEQGYITYHRSDSPFMASEAVGAIRAFISDSYGGQYLPLSAKMYKPKKGAQEAHECCRPTNISTASIGSGDQQKLYTLIWKRAVASQMNPGLDRRTKVATDIAGFDFITRGKVLLFDGFRKVWDYSSAGDVNLPDLKKGEKCTLLKLDKDQKFTTPPPRYSDASLNKRCEQEQIARPSTFGGFIETLKARGYIEAKKKSFGATNLGIEVIEFLKASDMCFVDLKFTAEMEMLLDAVAMNKKTKEEVLSDFWSRLKTDIEKGKVVRDKLKETGFACPKCGGAVLKRNSQWGAFYSCANWKKSGGCEYIANIGDKGEPIEKKPVEKEYADFPCKKCNKKMIKRTSKYGSFFGCSGFPSCREVADLEGNFKTSKKKSGKKN